MLYAESEIDLDDAEDCLKLLRTVARSEPLGVRPSKLSRGNVSAFKPTCEELSVLGLVKKLLGLFRSAMRRCSKKFTSKVISVIYFYVVSLCCSILIVCWSTGSPVDLPDENGFTPLHLSVQLNDYECIMVLLNIGVNINAATISGFTPLYLSIATRSKQAEQLLLENGARMFVESSWSNPGFSILDHTQPTSKKKTIKLPPLGVLQQVDAYLGIPDRQLMY